MAAYRRPSRARWLMRRAAAAGGAGFRGGNERRVASARGGMAAYRRPSRARWLMRGAGAAGSWETRSRSRGVANQSPKHQQAVMNGETSEGFGGGGVGG